MKRMLLGLLIALSTATPQLKAIECGDEGIETTHKLLKMEDLIDLPERVKALERSTVVLTRLSAASTGFMIGYFLGILWPPKLLGIQLPIWGGKKLLL